MSLSKKNYNKLMKFIDNAFDKQESKTETNIKKSQQHVLQKVYTYAHPNKRPVPFNKKRVGGALVSKTKSKKK